MYKNQYQMDTHAQGQQEQMHNPSQKECYPPQEGNATQPGNYPIMAAPPARNPSVTKTIQHQEQTSQPANDPLTIPPPSYSPPALFNIVNNQATVTTQAPAIITPVMVLDGPPPNHFLFALFTCLCCCWPISICALIKSSEVNSAYAAGDVHRAENASAAAKKYSTISFLSGIISVVGLVVLVIVATNISHH